MSVTIRWGMAMLFMASVWGMAAFLIYTSTPGWGWFLACVTLVFSCTSIQVSSKSGVSKGQEE